jgi:hypothetical protein
MTNDDIGDWRIEAAATLAEDVPAAYPGGPSHKAGAHIYLSHVVKHPRYNVFGFTTPSATALALSAAMKNAVTAYSLRDAVVLRDHVTPWGSGKGVANESLQPLFDFFESCMVAVITSFQAIEVFSNTVISKTLKGTYQLKRKKAWYTVTGEELERQASTDEKIGVILPKLLNVTTPKGKANWQSYLELKEARDATVHMKSQDAYTRKGIDRESLFFQFFRRDPREFPKIAFQIIEYFLPADALPRWAQEVKSELSKMTSP